MLIRDRSIMEKAMSITFDDIRLASTRLETQHQERKDFLVDMGYKLVREYTGSLSLPSPYWKDSNNTDRPYVYVGFVNAKDLFQNAPLPSLNLDDDYALSFKVATVVNDSPLSGGPHYLLSIKISCNDGRLLVDVANGMKKFTISSFKEDGCFYEVTAAMKQIIVSALTDDRLS